jgi:hypothetical protein
LTQKDKPVLCEGMALSVGKKKQRAGVQMRMGLLVAAHEDLGAAAAQSGLDSTLGNDVVKFCGQRDKHTNSESLAKTNHIVAQGKSHSVCVCVCVCLRVCSFSLPSPLLSDFLVRQFVGLGMSRQHRVSNMGSGVLDWPIDTIDSEHKGVTESEHDVFVPAQVFVQGDKMLYQFVHDWYFQV